MGVSISAISLSIVYLGKELGTQSICYKNCLKFTDVLKNCLKKLTGPQSYEDPNFNKTG